MEAEDRFNARRERILHDIAQAAREKSDNGMTVGLAELDALDDEEAKFRKVVKSVPKADADPEKVREFHVRLLIELRALAEKVAKLERIVGAGAYARPVEQPNDEPAAVGAYSGAGKEQPTVLATEPESDF